MKEFLSLIVIEKEWLSLMHSDTKDLSNTEISACWESFSRNAVGNTLTSSEDLRKKEKLDLLLITKENNKDNRLVMVKLKNYLLSSALSVIDQPITRTP